MCIRDSKSTEGDAPTVLDAVAAADAAIAWDPELGERLDRLYRTLDPGEGLVRVAGDELAAHLPGSRFAWLATSLTTLDGRVVGALHVLRVEPDFSELDEAIVAQLAQMASATLERMQAYRR